MKRVLLVVGTRPEAIKVAPVALALGGSSHLAPIVATTGQHPHLVQPMLDLFGLRADIALTLDRTDGRLEEVVAGTVLGLGRVLAEHRPDAVLVPVSYTHLTLPTNREV